MNPTKLHRISIALIILSIFQIKVYGDNSEKVTCGRRLVNHEALIVNGYESKEGDYPWHASVLHVELDQNIQYKCGGTLLNSNSILTAAHCVYENSRPIVPDRVLIQLGRYNLKISGPHSQEIEVYQTLPHESFNVSSLANDIAIIRLATKVNFDYVQPVCLWESNKKALSDVVGKCGTVVGFGITETDKISYTLRQAVIPVVDTTTCLESDREFFGSFLSATTFCAGFRNGTTACNGDSGGSLTFEENGVYRIRGIVSLTQARPGNNQQYCKTDQYVVFTDVAQYLDWIHEAVHGLLSTDLTSESVPSSSIKYCYFLNNDLTNARIGRDICEERCASTPLCTHFTWTYHDGGTCWMKRNPVSANDAHNSEDKAGFCGIVKDSAHIEWHGDWAFGCDFWENNLTNVKSDGSNDCYNLCAHTADCTHFTWNGHDGGTCWMKRNAVGKVDAFVSKDKAAVCGIGKKIAWNGRNSAFACDFPGNDVKNVRSRREDCKDQCALNSQCTHFAWNGFSGGTCWLKHFHGVSKNDAVVTSDTSSICGLL